MEPEKGNVIYNFLRGTDSDITEKEKIAITGFIDEECIKQARQKGFKFLFGTNTSPLTQQLSESFFGYEKLSTVQINEFVDKNGKRPFKNAPSHYVAVVMIKKL